MLMTGRFPLHESGLFFFFFKQKTAYEILTCDWSSDVCFFFLKQKTAYEILTCDWSSDVCSSDLQDHPCTVKQRIGDRVSAHGPKKNLQAERDMWTSHGELVPGASEIGRASCRERV